MKDSHRFAVPKRWLSDEAVMLVDSVARWGERDVSDRRGEHREDFEQLHRPALASLMQKVGLQDLFWTEAGDGPLSAVMLAAVLEEVGRVDTGLAVVLANTAALQRCVSSEQRPALGERGAPGALVLPGYSLPESSARSQRPAPEAALGGLSAQVRARASADGWVLAGTGVRPQCHGAQASTFGIVTTLEGEPAVFAVPAAAPGLRVGDPLRQTGLRGCPNADLELRDVTVDRAALLLRGQGQYATLLDWYYLGCAAAVSGAQRAMHRILDDWCDSRVIKGRGQAFKDNALVAGLLGDIGGRVGSGRILMLHLARELDAGDGEPEAIHATAVATARALVRDAHQSLDQAMELMASAGYATEWNLERYWRDVKTLGSYLMLETAGRLELARHYFGCRNV